MKILFVLVFAIHLDLFISVNGRYELGRCGSRLEAALDQMRRRQAARDSRSKLEDDLNKLSIEKNLRSTDENIVISQLRVRMPGNPKWVRVDQCSYHPNNSSLDTKLLFPDLTISGSVAVRPRGASCNMILRLRRAGIKFTTRPLGRSEGTVNVRTDSQFTEPGFLSVFAHGCEVKDVHHRRNGKYMPPDRFVDRNYEQNGLRNGNNRYGNEHSRPYDDYDRYYDRKQHKSFDEGDNFSLDDNKFVIYDNEPSSRQGRIFDVFESDLYEEDGLSNTDDYQDGGDMTREMEDIFSKGIRGLLTSYMQRALQPAIKETLMSSMGYTISYGR